MSRVKLKNPIRTTYTPASPTGRPYRVWRWHLVDYDGYVESIKKRGPYDSFGVSWQGQCYVGTGADTLQEAAQRVVSFYQEGCNRRPSDV